MTKSKSITLGQRLAELRTAQGLTVYRLGKAAGVPPISIARIESGEKQQPAFQTIEKLAAALQVSLDEFKTEP